MMDLLVEAARSLPYVLAAIAALLVVAALVVWLLARAARRAPWGESGAGGGVAGWAGRLAGDLRAHRSGAPLRRTFAARRRQIVRATGGARAAAQLPWCMLIGQARAGKSTLAALCGLALPYGEPAAPAAEAPCRFWLYPEGMVLDVAGDLVLRRDGRTADEDLWNAVLRLVARERPRRPLDGVMLAIPATALIGRGGLEGAADSELQNDAAQRAALLWRKLAQLQEATGMRLPVYVVITESDLLPGWSAFADLLPAAARGQMFGWSNPDSAATAYSPSWVDTLFAQLLTRLDQDLAEVLGSRAAIAGNEAAFEVVRSVEAVREPVRIYLNQLFSASAFHEASPLRGLYFTGARFGGDDAALVVPRDSAPPPAGTAAPTAIDFARDLLAAKVFPEAPLAVPTGAAMSAARWRRFAMQAALAVLLLAAAIGLPAAGRATAAVVHRLMPLYAEIEHDLDEEQAWRAGNAEKPENTRNPAGAPGKAARSDPREPATRRLLAFAREIDDYTAKTLLLPASWLSPIDGDQRQAAARGYGRVTLPAVRASLDGQLAALGAATAPPRQTPDATPRAYAKSAEFQALAAWTGEEAAAEARVALYDCIVERCTTSAAQLTADLDSLTRWAFNESFKPPTWGAVRFYGAVLRASGTAGAEPIPYPPAGNDFGLRQRATALNAAFDSRLFDNNAVAGDLDALAEDLRQLGLQRDAFSGGRGGRDGRGGAAADLAAVLQAQSRPGAASYQQLLDRIVKTSHDLAAPEVAWMGAPALDLGAPYTQELAAVGTSRFLGAQLAAAMTAAGNDGFRQMKAALLAYESPYTGPFLAAQDGQVQLKLSPGLLNLEKALQGLLGQSFMTPAPGWPAYPPSGADVLLWDANLLQQAQAATQPLAAFYKQGLLLFPAGLQLQVAQLARTNTRDEMVETIARAAHWQPGPTRRVPEILQQSIAGQVASFQTAAPLLGPLGASFTTMGFPSDAQRLGDLVEQERRGILDQAWLLLALDNLYSTFDPTFSWWEGKAGLAFPAFGVADASGLGGYLDTQRQTVTDVADNDAQPVLAASGALPALDGGVAARWKTVLADLDAYKAKKAGNPLQTLEGLIAPTLEDVTVATCLAQVAAPGARLGADYFLGRQDDLAAGVHDRCARLLDRDARRRYEKLARLFNDSLAGRFPFTEGQPVRQDVRADPAAVAGFYAAYDAAQPLIAQVPASDPVFGDHRADVDAFMARMKEVRTLFAPYLDTPQQYPQPTLGFSVEFRVNFALGDGSDQIFTWLLGVGDATVERGGATATGRWSYGMPSALTLTWAQNSPAVPMVVEGSLWGSVAGRTVTYQYGDPWGLLALLRDQDAKLPSAESPKAVTLAQTVTTQNQPSPPLPATQQARAFIRITLTTPDGKTQLALPHFPAYAPWLDSLDP